MPQTNWTTANIPDLKGKLAVVTGATGGLGYETAFALTKAGATVILSGRNESKGEDAVNKILAICPGGKVKFGKVDHCSLASVVEFSSDLSKKYESLDILINNAGVTVATVPQRGTTVDGFEIIFGTNHLSHFALTAQLLPMLRKSSAPRVVNVSSIMHRSGKINFDDLQSEKCKYDVGIYSQSKVANLLFTLELQKRSDAGVWGIMSTAAHPGFSITDMTNAPSPGVIGFFTDHVIKPWFSQSAACGALPILFAATSPEAKRGAYYGPDGFYELRGSVAPAHIAPVAQNGDTAAKLWDVSTTLTNVTWP